MRKGGIIWRRTLCIGAWVVYVGFCMSPECYVYMSGYASVIPGRNVCDILIPGPGLQGNSFECANTS